MAKLTATQEQALLLLASGETVTRTAEAAGVSRQTCSEWVNRDPDFIAALNSVRLLSARGVNRTIPDRNRTIPERKSGG